MVTCMGAQSMRIQGRSFLLPMVLVLQFVVLPSAARIKIFPAEVIAGLGSFIALTCTSISSIINNAEWLVNGTSLNKLQLDVIVDHTVLQIWNVTAELNNSRIQCIGDSVPSTMNSILLVQGLLSAVGSLLVDVRVDHIYVNWTAPFTLDISTTLVDITYCVDVVSSTSSATLHSECGITETEFTYPLPRSGCHEYNFTVTPVNVVGNGTSNADIYQIPPGLEVINSSVTTANTTTTFIFVMTSPICQATVTFHNIYSDDRNNIIAVNDTELTVSRTTIFGSVDMTSNSVYEIILFVSNVHDANRYEKIISTFDITDCSVYQLDENIVILVNFVQHTEATGALLSFIYINEDGTVDFSVSFSRVVEKNRDFQNATISLNVSYPGDYVVYAYDIERDKQIANGLNYQASVCNFSASDRQVKELSSLTPQKGSCTVSNRNLVIYVECLSFPNFQVTAQINDSKRVNVLHVNSSSQSIASVEVPENEEYLLTVLPIQDGKRILSGMAFSYVHTVTMTTHFPSPSSFTPSFTPSSREPEVNVSSECTTQTSMPLVIVLNIFSLFGIVTFFSNSHFW